MKNIFVGAMFLLALTACKQSEVESGSVPASAPAQGVASAPSQPAVTSEALIGIYGGALPCGDCKAVNTRLELLADGKYKVNEVFDGRVDNNVLDSDGTWTLDSAANLLTLNPTAQDWADRVFKVKGSSVLGPLDGAGVEYSTDGVNDLRRE